MIYIVHGENVTASRNYIIGLQKDARQEVDITGTSADALYSVCRSNDMFGAKPAVVFDVSKMGRTNADDYVKVLSGAPADTLMIIYSDKELSAANPFIKNAAMLKARIVENKQVAATAVFKFVDAAFSGNRAQSYKELRNLIVSAEDPIYILSMLEYGLRNVAYAKFSSPEYEKASPFVKSKAKSQSQKFPEEKIEKLFGQFYAFDLRVKTGFIPADLVLVLAVEAILDNV